MRLEQPLADGLFNGREFPIGLVKLDLGRLRAKFGGDCPVFRIRDTRLGLLQGPRYFLKLAVELVDDFPPRPLRGVPLLFGQLQFPGQAFAHRLQ